MLKSGLVSLMDILEGHEYLFSDELNGTAYQVSYSRFSRVTSYFMHLYLFEIICCFSFSFIFSRATKLPKILKKKRTHVLVDIKRN